MTAQRRRPRLGSRGLAGPLPGLSRREFLIGLGAVGLAACTDGGGAPTYDLGNSSSLRMLNWPDYIDVDNDNNAYYSGGTLDALVEAGISVDYAPLYEDNIDGFALIEEALAVSPAGYDIVVPTNWRAAQMIANGQAEPLPIEVIPNHVNIDPVFLTNAWDRGCRYQMPWQAGITGIAYDPKLTGRALTSVEDLFADDLAGRVGFIGEMREAVGLVMLANGDDPSRPTRAAAEVALERIENHAATGGVGAFTFGDFADLLQTGELAAAMAWSGDVALLQSQQPDIEFLIPDEGAIQWFDTMVIPTGSASIEAAGRFMNFVYDPDNAARITEWVQYISPVLGVDTALRAQGGAALALADNPVLFPDDATRARLFTWGGLEQTDEDELDARYGLLVG